jgi:hypothetical protein
MVAARYLHTTTLLSNGQVLVSGGHDNVGSLASSELYAPSATATDAGNDAGLIDGGLPGDAGSSDAGPVVADAGPADAGSSDGGAPTRRPETYFVGCDCNSGGVREAWFGAAWAAMLAASRRRGRRKSS